MAGRATPPVKTFTIEQANAMLPLVRAITSDLTNLAREIVERRQQLSQLTAGRKSKAGDPYSEELVQMEADLERSVERVHGYLQELTDLGVEPKGAVEGLVDFPCKMDGRVVYLCWRLGEAEVLHWHEINAGFAGRQSLVAGSSTGEREKTFLAE